MNRVLIVIGLLVFLAGVLWPLLIKLPIGRLPGDLVVRREGFTLFIPFTSMIIISLLITFLLWFFKK